MITVVSPIIVAVLGTTLISSRSSTVSLIATTLLIEFLVGIVGKRASTATAMTAIVLVAHVASGLVLILFLFFSIVLFFLKVTRSNVGNLFKGGFRDVFNTTTESF
jgi:Ni,Fe-hydrogenase I cytochrome b subunit